MVPCSRCCARRAHGAMSTVPYPRCCAHSSRGAVLIVPCPWCHAYDSHDAMSVVPCLWHCAHSTGRSAVPWRPQHPLFPSQGTHPHCPPWEPHGHQFSTPWHRAPLGTRSPYCALSLGFGSSHGCGFAVTALHVPAGVGRREASDQIKHQRGECNLNNEFNLALHTFFKKKYIYYFLRKGKGKVSMSGCSLPTTLPAAGGLCWRNGFLCLTRLMLGVCTALHLSQPTFSFHPVPK